MADKNTPKLIRTYRGYVVRSEFNPALPQAMKAAGCKWNGNEWAGLNGPAMRAAVRSVYGDVADINVSTVMSAADLVDVVNQYGRATPEFMPNDPGRGQWIASILTPMLSTEQLQAVRDTSDSLSESEARYTNSVSEILRDRRRQAAARGR